MPGWPHRGFSPDLGGGGHHRFGRRHHQGRTFHYGELRLLLLCLIAECPRHGYELIKAIEQQMGGSYSPSPGVIYPALSWLNDMGYIAAETGATKNGGRKSFRITTEGEAFLAANRSAAEELRGRGAPGTQGGPAAVPNTIIRAMENLKLAIRLRLRQGPISGKAADDIADALNAAAKLVERSH